MLDPVKEFEKKDETDEQLAIRHAAMEDLIKSSETKFLRIEHNGKEIRIRPAIPGRMRAEVLQLAKKYKGVNLQAIKDGKPSEYDMSYLPELQKDEEDQLYKMLSAICLDAPYTDPESWRYYDSITGEAGIIYQKAEAAMREAQATAISFRPKS
jgi:hypothetical protein